MPANLISGIIFFCVIKDRMQHCICATWCAPPFLSPPNPSTVPNVTAVRSELLLLIEAYCFLFEKYDLNHSFTKPCIP